jgi:hypothetical protein
MKSYKVNLSITKTYSAEVVIQGDYSDLNDPDLIKAAELAAENMSHESWDYKDTEFDFEGSEELPEGLSPFHITLLQSGYPKEMVLAYSLEDAEAEIESMGY